MNSFKEKDIVYFTLDQQKINRSEQNGYTGAKAILEALKFCPMTILVAYPTGCCELDLKPYTGMLKGIQYGGCASLTFPNYLLQADETDNLIPVLLKIRREIGL